MQVTSEPMGHQVTSNHAPHQLQQCWAPVRDRQVSNLSCSECDLWRGQQSGGRSDLFPAQLGRPTRQLGVRGGAGAVPQARDLPSRQREVPQRRVPLCCGGGPGQRPTASTLPDPTPATLPIKLFVSVES